MLQKWHATDEQVLNAKFTMPLYSLNRTGVPFAGTLAFRSLQIDGISNWLPPRAELPSPESQSGETLAPPLGGAFFMAIHTLDENMSHILTFLSRKAYRYRNDCTTSHIPFLNMRRLSLKGIARFFPERTTCPATLRGFFVNDGSIRSKYGSERPRPHPDHKAFHGHDLAIYR